MSGRYGETEVCYDISAKRAAELVARLVPQGGQEGSTRIPWVSGE